jgi:hypothetical protein
MKLTINLASQPYRDLPRYLRRVLPWLIALAAITLVLASYALHQWRAAAAIDHQVAAEQQQKARLEAQRQAAVKLLGQPENQILADKSEMINQLIDNKRFSWTSFFMEMESILPPKLLLASVTPQLNGDGSIRLQLDVEGDTHEQVLELLQRLEASPHFTKATLISEEIKRDEKTGPMGRMAVPDARVRYRFALEVTYLPQAGAGKVAR